MTVKVVLWGDLSREHTGVKDSEVEARNLRGVIRSLDEQYPGLAKKLRKTQLSRSTVSFATVLSAPTGRMRSISCRLSRQDNHAFSLTLTLKRVEEAERARAALTRFDC